MTRAFAGLHRRGWEVETKPLRVSGFSQAGGDGGRVAGLSVVCARSGSERCAVFQGRFRLHSPGRFRGSGTVKYACVARKHSGTF